jgi:hypothetical protein
MINISNLLDKGVEKALTDLRNMEPPLVSVVPSATKFSIIVDIILTHRVTAVNPKQA